MTSTLLPFAARFSLVLASSVGSTSWAGATPNSAGLNSAGPVSSGASGDAAVSYHAPANCPSSAEFAALVAQRGVQLVPAPRGGDGEFSIGIELRGDEYVGMFQVNGQGSSAQPREVVSSTCAEVADALAVVTAIAARRANEAGESPALETEASSQAQPPSKPTPSDNQAPTPAAQESPPERFRYVAGGRPDWIRPGGLHHETEVPSGTVSLDFKLAIDTQAGVSVGLLPRVAVPRYDLTMRNAIFLTTPSEDPFLVGIMPRLRLSFLGPATKETNGVTSELSGFQFAMGACLTPYYDDRGLILLACAEYGGNAMSVRSTQGERRREQPVGSGIVALAFEAEYNISSVVHLGLRGGWEQRLPGDHRVEGFDGETLFELGGGSLFVTAGVGIHF